MNIIRLLATILVMCVLVAACTTSPGTQRGKVICPACGTEFEALYEKRF